MSDVLPLDLTRLQGRLCHGRAVAVAAGRRAAAAARRQRRRRGLDRPGAGGHAAGARGGAGGDAAGGARPALGRPVRGQGQYRRRRPADHRRLPRLRLHAQAVGDRGRPAGRGRGHPGRQDQPRPVRDRAWSACARPTASPATRSIAAFIPGGSSSGSGVAVAAGLVSFALGTDTAGSGRVPAAFTNIVGLKPTKGMIPTRGVVPACRSLDCVSIFALTAADAASVLEVAGGFDPADPFSRARGAAPGPRLRRPQDRRPRGRTSASSSAMQAASAIYDARAGARARPWAPSWSRSTSPRSWSRPSCSTPAPGSPSAPPPWASSWRHSPTRSGRRPGP